MSLSLFLSACATDYKGPLPDLNKKGPAAQEEFRQFYVNDDFWDQAAFYQMGPNKEQYWLKSMEPVLEHVSPESRERLEKAYKLQRASQVLIWGAVAAILLIPSQDDQTKSQLWGAYFVGFGGSVATGLMSAHERAEAAKIYNRDLKNKLIPDVNLTWNF